MPNDSAIVPIELHIKQIMPHDYLARISGTSIETLDLTALHPTEAVVGSFQDFLQRIVEKESTLVAVIKKQKNLIDYNSYYISYLSNQITEDEFYKIAEGFAYSTQQSCDEADIEKKTMSLLGTTGLSFSVSDLSYFWECSEEIIDTILERLKANKSVR
jgi:CRP-like cAMP-binding protein